MFVLKSKYFFIIESIKDICLKNIKLSNKFNIIYRNNGKIECFEKLMQFRKTCRTKKIDFYIANDTKLVTRLKADGLYISAYNKDLRLIKFKRLNYKIIGSAHNIKELNIKNIQGCSDIVYSRLFDTSYSFKHGSLGVIKFNLLSISRKEKILPLGGINSSRINKLNIIKSDSFALLSEVKKKPAIISRLF
jgi:thiamine-phosphate pyrophosphorylase